MSANSWSFRKKFFVSLIILVFGLMAFQTCRVVERFSQVAGVENSEPLAKNEILHLEIHGVIMNGKKFLAQLKKYKKDERIKAIVIDINSPGGAVGPSQEIYYEILRAKEETKKPVVCVSTGLIASGGYYASLACDKIVVAPGTMIGSIGVIMEFANLEKLYDWAKVSRYTIKSGKFKDSGSEYRAMRDDERALFQSMIDEVYAQFRDAVVERRKLELEIVNSYADGRVMTGATAVKLKFADKVGTFEDAIKLAAQEAKLSENDYKVFKPQRTRNAIMDFLSFNEDEDDLNSTDSESRDWKISFMQKMSMGGSSLGLEALAKGILKSKFLNQPLYLMPGYWE